MKCLSILAFRRFRDPPGWNEQDSKSRATEREILGTERSGMRKGEFWRSNSWQKFPEGKLWGPPPPHDTL